RYVKGSLEMPAGHAVMIVGGSADPAGLADMRSAPSPSAMRTLLQPTVWPGLDQHIGHPSVVAASSQRCQGFRPTPHIPGTSPGSAKGVGSGRHCVSPTTPGSTSSRPSKNPAICSGLRGWYVLAEFSL